MKEKYLSQNQATYKELSESVHMTNNLLDDWVDNLEVTPEQVREGNYDMEELKDLAEQEMSPALITRWLSLYLPARRDVKQGRAATDNGAYVLCRVVQLVEALEFYKQQVQNLKEKQDGQGNTEQV